jgi:formylglycine-generating enzyme required for sulfatase activity
VTVPVGGGVLFSCGRGPFAFETATLGTGHGVFFYHAIEGLQGKAKDEEGAVTWDGLSAYLKRQVPRYVAANLGKGARQVPASAGNQEGESVLAAYAAGHTPSLPKELPVEGEQGFKMEFVLVPATGEKGFVMGSGEDEREAVRKALGEAEQPPSLKAEGPAHKVIIRKPFYLGKYEVTQKQYLAVVGSNPSYFSKQGKGKDKVENLDTSDFPVETVSHEDAEKFCSLLSQRPAEKRAGRTYRLPTEAEWEHACRGGGSAPFCFEKPSDSVSHGQANFDSQHPYGGGDKGAAPGGTCRVDSYKPNPYGLYNMHGNVWEWCSDWYDPGYYGKSDLTDPIGPRDKMKSRVLRGGSWKDGGPYCRAASRYDSSPDYRNVQFGFRVVCVVAPRD